MDAKGRFRAIVYLEGFESEPAARRLAFRVHALALCVGLGVVIGYLYPIGRAARPVPVEDGADDGLRFGLTLADRRAIFAEIASAEPEQRTKAQKAFPGHEWSQEDERCSSESGLVRAIAAKRALSLTQVYLVLDEGIRRRWPDQFGRPLIPTTIPLTPRRM